MIGVNGVITNDKFCVSRITHLRLGYCRLPEDRKQLLAALSGYPSDKENNLCQGGSHETTPMEDQTPSYRTSRCRASLESGVSVSHALDELPASASAD
jgi:hypothetical protein